MTSARNQAAGPQSASDTQYNVRDAALLGASLAFSKPPVKPKPQSNTYIGGNNAALLAAAKVGTPPPVKRDWTGGSSRSVSSRPNTSSMHIANKSSISSTLGVPDQPFDRVPSPSNIAARLAAARHSPLRPLPQPALASTLSARDADDRDILPPSGSVGNVLARFEPQRPVPQPRKSAEAVRPYYPMSPTKTQSVDRPTDDTSIPPTTTLVKIFEQNRPTNVRRSSTTPLNVAQSSPPPIRSPKPQRTFKIPQGPGEDAMLQRTKSLTPPPLKPKPKLKMGSLSLRSIDSAITQTPIQTLHRDPTKSMPITQEPTQLTTITTSTLPPKPPPQRGTRSRSGLQNNPRPMSAHRRLSASIESLGTPESPVSFKSAKEEQDEDDDRDRERSKPLIPPSRRPTQRQIDAAASVRTPLAAHVLTPARKQNQAPPLIRPIDRLSPPIRPASTGAPSASVYHNKYQRQSMQQITKHMTGETLSSAIMGAALAASSRNASPARSVPIEPFFPPSRKQHRHHSPFHRSPSPPKQSPQKAGKMRTTLRKEPSSSEDEDEVEKYKKKGTRIMGIKQRKHPNKHHEGTRRRWRDQITERERKRYEGVWAANKGAFLPSLPDPTSRGTLADDPSLEVLNISVQEIWTRSRLPTHVLEEVWDLVDSKGVGRLSRYEFVVGLWLIDQRLKGRKLPIKVSDSVWDSARGVGLRVKSVK